MSIKLYLAFLGVKRALSKARMSFDDVTIGHYLALFDASWPSFILYVSILYLALLSQSHYLLMRSNAIGWVGE